MQVFVEWEYNLLLYNFKDLNIFQVFKLLELNLNLPIVLKYYKYFAHRFLIVLKDFLIIH